MKTPFMLVLCALLAPIASFAEEAATSFIRVDEDAKAARLQTAVTRYEKDGVHVDLIGAVHIADKAYYEKLNTRFENYDSLLFEMIGGERMQEVQPAADEDLAGLHQIYDMISRFLALTSQKAHIDYTVENFVHADLTHAEFTKMQAERGESLLGFAMKAAENPDAENQLDPARLMRAMLSGNSSLVKLEIIHTLGKGDDQIAAFAGESVIITDRNLRCIEVMDREITAGRKKLGIFYGAAHFPDMEQRLLAKGFKRTRQEWFTAWDVPKAKAAEQPAAEEEKEAA